MKDISESNKLIAEFMGYKILHKHYETQMWCSSNESYWGDAEGDIVCDANGNEVDDERQEPYYDLEALPFNYLIDWLMPVIKKIESLTYKDIKIYSSVTLRRFKHIDIYWVIDGVTDCGNNKRTISNFIINHEDNEIDTLYKTIVGFIKWYNNNLK